MNKNGTEITLNFLALSKQDVKFTICRKEILHNEFSQKLSDKEIRKYNVPINPFDKNSEYKEYFISVENQEGFDESKISPSQNPYLAKFILFKLLVDKCNSVLIEKEYWVVEKFRKYVSFVLTEDLIGRETVWVEPYYLWRTKQLGLLCGFHYNVPDGTQLNKRILQKSLSLSSDGRENKNYYLDHYRMIERFLEKYRDRIFPISTRNSVAFDIIWPPKALIAERLETKTYIFANGMESNSQFQGIKRYGPLKKISSNSLICFMYLQKDKDLSYELYHALKGDKFATFSGMESMFSFSLGKEHVTGMPIQGYDNNNIESSIEKLTSAAADRPVLPLILFPWSRTKPTDEGRDTYFRIKHQFLKRKIPIQFVSLDRMRSRDGLKWSISNIALAVFGKLGGKPWKLLPKNMRCLIIGIGQAHQKSEHGEIMRYFSYSVLSDSSGLYDSIRILAKSDNKDIYLSSLSQRLKEVLKDLSKDYERFVIHTPFKLRNDEMVAIKDALNEFNVESDKENTLVVLKFNEKSKHFGFDLKNNSKVPFESSCVSLGKGEYLIWFEGLQYHNPTVRRRFSRPMHIEFCYSNNDIYRNEEIAFLQDAINLSGANWRGFNAKSFPVSIYYSKIIADFIGEFDRLGLPEIDIENLPPWFL